ncbi:FCD domain-containing protein [Virgibacillus dakarensis]|uniref:GntR family transcriptional regulator n=1 Tax=Lentibacillus populi TaxID=1827502 RepID=A0A9W5U249_9BACI|nr:MULTISPECIES: GntR family transcriptional regulator [Bacillaceae]MBT2216451.1 GntR family transcriptional regulator [Virgibacillus dakarensis]MTW85853.1 FCD domain-containing protein [Virgibacillus dakarensis]GGB59975.1 GntR family transcriptional regulator [Lentibacillus populi]
MKNHYPEKRLTTRSIGERVVAELRMRIISKDIAEGTILSENQVAKEYQVSRSPIREAFKVLEKEGLIRLQRMGAVVVGISEQDIDEIYDIRLMIESFVFERVLTRDNEKLINELNQIIEMMKVAIRYKDADEFSFKDVEFHETIVKSIHHNYILMLWSNLRPVMECLILLSMRHRLSENDKDFNRVIRNHELMVESIVKKDKNLAQQAFFKNFNDVQHYSNDSLWNLNKI